MVGLSKITLRILSVSYTHLDVYKRQAFGGVLAVIHAPHAVQKLDISNPEEFESNRQRLMSSQQFADMLRCV